jgi:hypothetical protein
MVTINVSFIGADSLSLGEVQNFASKRSQVHLVYIRSKVTYRASQPTRSALFSVSTCDLSHEKDIKTLIGRICLATDMPETTSEAHFCPGFFDDLNIRKNTFKLLERGKQ